jgi:hypothetical protein
VCAWLLLLLHWPLLLWCLLPWLRLLLLLLLMWHCRLSVDSSCWGNPNSCHDGAIEF